MARKKSFRLTMAELGRLERYVDGVGKTISNDRALQIIEQEIVPRTKAVFDYHVASYGTTSDRLTNNFKVTLTRLPQKGSPINIRLSNSMHGFKYYEYGTGVPGDDNPHPLADSIGWEYGAYSGFGSWRYVKDGKSYLTTGQASKPVLYETFEWCKANYGDLLKVKLVKPTVNL